ncbi:hypothetical protein LRY64_02725 [Candidatus Woesebacteria bacterium]|nr:hypothetical protein [Candidatus Woesebacteria bacterium]
MSELNLTFEEMAAQRDQGFRPEQNTENRQIFHNKKQKMKINSLPEHKSMFNVANSHGTLKMNSLFSR